MEGCVSPKRVALVAALAGLALIAAISSIAVLKYVPGYATYLGATKGADCTAERARFGSNWVTLPIDTEILDGEIAVYRTDAFSISVLCVQGKLTEIQYQFSAFSNPTN